MTNWTTLLLLADVELKDEVTFGEIVRQFNRRENFEYFIALLKKVGINDFQQVIVETPYPSLAQWIQAMVTVGGRPSEMLYDTQYIVFKEMDVPMLGLVRELHRHGIETFYSCSGHGRQNPVINFKTVDDKKKATNLLQNVGINIRCLV